MGIRGIILTSPAAVNGNTFTVFGSAIEPLLLRQGALYWDMIDWPNNSVVGTGDEGKPDIQLLKQEGKLIRSSFSFPMSFSGADAAKPWVWMQILALFENNKRPGQQWTIGQPNPTLELPSDVAPFTRAIEVELYQAIPVPLADVPMERILDFKERRRDELLRFRGVMDDLYLEVVRTQDIPRAKSRALHKVQQAIRSLNRVTNESRLKTILSSLKVELNLSNIVNTALVTGISQTALAATYQWPPEISIPVSLGLGLATSGITVRINEIPKPNALPTHLIDYAYLFHVDRELAHLGETVEE